jgi:Leucine-rich repeat (LRR) protein
MLRNFILSNFFLIKWSIILSILINSYEQVSLNMTKNFDGILTHEKLIEWGYSQSTTIMDLRYKRIRSIEENTFQEFKKLQQLILSYNELEGISEEYFTGLISLKTLDLGYNSIETIKENSFKSLKNLEFIEMRNNNL